MKRVFDLVFSTFLLLSLSLVIVTVAILVKLKLGAPIVFKQQRPGLYEKPFYIYKFRTMTDERNSEGDLLPDCVRLTPFGRFLRKYSLDELLQLVNVLKGELSIVGPRPLLMEYIPLYTSEQSKRHQVKPGITGWAQVNGRNAISWEERFSLDVWYVENRSFFLDVKIIFLTLKKVLMSEGIQNNEHTTMPVFKGSSNEKTPRKYSAN